VGEDTEDVGCWPFQRSLLFSVGSHFALKMEMVRISEILTHCHLPVIRSTLEKIQFFHHYESMLLKNV
jgi:hypothetical protein